MKKHEQSSMKTGIISIILVMAVFAFALSSNDGNKITGMVTGPTTDLHPGLRGALDRFKAGPHGANIKDKITIAKNLDKVFSGEHRGKQIKNQKVINLLNADDKQILLTVTDDDPYHSVRLAIANTLNNENIDDNTRKSIANFLGRSNINQLATDENEQVRETVSQIIRNNEHIQNMLGIPQDQADIIANQIQTGEWEKLTAPQDTIIKTSEGTFVVKEDGIYRKSPWWQFWKEDEKIDKTDEYIIVPQLNTAGIAPVVVQNRYVGTDTYDLLAPDGTEITIRDTTYQVRNDKIYKKNPWWMFWNRYTPIKQENELDTPYQIAVRDLNFQHQIDNGHGIYQGVDQDNQPALFRVNPDGSVNIQKPDTDNWVATDYDQSTIDSNPNFARILSPILTEMYTKDGRLFYGDLSSTNVYSRDEDGFSDDWTQEGDITLDQLRFTRDYTRILTAPDDIKTSIGDTKYYVKDGKIYEERFGRDREVTSSDRYYNDIAGQLNEGIPSAPEERPESIPPSFPLERPPSEIPPPEVEGIDTRPIIIADSEIVYDIDQLSPITDIPQRQPELTKTEVLDEHPPHNPQPGEIYILPEMRTIIVNEGKPNEIKDVKVQSILRIEEDDSETYITSLPWSDWQDRVDPELTVSKLLGNDLERRYNHLLDNPPLITITTAKTSRFFDNDMDYFSTSETTSEKRDKDGKLLVIYETVEEGKVIAYEDKNENGIMDEAEYLRTYVNQKEGDYKGEFEPWETDINYNWKTLVNTFGNSQNRWGGVYGDIYPNNIQMLQDTIKDSDAYHAVLREYQAQERDYSSKSTQFENNMNGITFMGEDNVQFVYVAGEGWKQLVNKGEEGEALEIVKEEDQEKIFDQFSKTDNVYRVQLVDRQPTTSWRPSSELKAVFNVLTEGGTIDYDKLSPFNKANLAKLGITNKDEYAQLFKDEIVYKAQDSNPPKELTLAQRIFVKRQGANRLISQGDSLSKQPTTTARTALSAAQSEARTAIAEAIEGFQWTPELNSAYETYKERIEDGGGTANSKEEWLESSIFVSMEHHGIMDAAIATQQTIPTIERLRAAITNVRAIQDAIKAGTWEPPTTPTTEVSETTAEALNRIANLVPSWMVLGMDRDIAARLIENGELEHAAAILESLGETDQAADLYYRAAAKTLLELGETEAAAEIYMNLGEYERAAQLFDQFGTGNLPKAAEAYIKAAEELVKSGATPIDIETMYAMAGIIYFEMGDYKSEAELWAEVARKTTDERSKQYQDSAVDAYQRLLKYNIQSRSYEEAIKYIDDLLPTLKDPEARAKLMNDKQLMDNIAYVYSRYPGWFGKTRVPQIMDFILGNKYVSFLTNEGYPNILGLWFQKRDDKWDTPISDTWNNWLSGPDGIAADRCKGKVAIDDLDGGFATSAKIGGPYATIEGEKITIINHTNQTPDTFYYYKISMDVYPGTKALGCDLKFQVYLDKDEENKNGNEVHLMKDDAGNDYTWDIRRGDPAVSYKGIDMIVRKSQKEYKRVCIDLKRIIPRGERSCLIGIEEGDQLCSIIKEGETHEFDFKCNFCDGWGAKFTTLFISGWDDRKRGDTGDSGTSSSGTSDSDQPGPYINKEI